MKLRKHGKQKSVAKSNKDLSEKADSQPQMSEEDCQPESLEYSLSLPDFQFVEFAGLDGFDRRSCMWLPQSDSEASNTGDNNCRVKPNIPQFSNAKANEENPEYSPLKKHSKKNHTGHSNSNTFFKEKSNVQLPAIFHGNQGKRGCPGQLVYESPRNACKEDMVTKMDKIKAFGGARNSSHKLHTGKNCCLPPLNGVARLSSSVHCQSFNNNESMLRKNYMAYKMKSLGGFVKEHGVVPLIPWKGRSFPRISCSIQNQHDDLMGKKSLVKKCGGGGYATAVGLGRTALSTFVSQPKSARTSRPGEPRAHLRRFRF